MTQVFDPSATPVIDDQVMHQLLDLDDGRTGLIEEMFQLYQEDTPGRLDVLETAIRDGRSVEVAETAHAVKGAASTMGIPRAKALAARLEAAGRLNDLSFEDMAAVLAQLRTAYAESLGALAAFIASR